jgi:hypothetical protein
VGGDEELRTLLDEVVDPGQRGHAALRGERGLRLVEQVEPARPEAVDEQVEEGLAVRALVRRGTAVGRKQSGPRPRLRVEPLHLGGDVVVGLGPQEEGGALAARRPAQTQR